MLGINTGDNFLNNNFGEIFEHEFHIVDLGISLGFVK